MPASKDSDKDNEDKEGNEQNDVVIEENDVEQNIPLSQHLVFLRIHLTIHISAQQTQILHRHRPSETDV